MYRRARYALSEASRPLSKERGCWPLARAFVTLVAAFGLPGPVYEWSRNKYQIAFFAFQTGLRLYPFAVTRLEKVGLATLSIRLLLRGLARRSLTEKDYVVRLQHIKHVVSLVANELHTVQELYGERYHDRLDRFIPQAGWMVFDVGANVGIYTTLQASRGAVVCAFEPNPNCRRRLTRTVALNGLGDRVNVFPWALGSGRGTGMLRVPGEGQLTTLGEVEVVEPRIGNPAGIAITTLDEMVAVLGISKMDLLKIDVEGAEVDVLRGARDALQITDRVVVEGHSADAERVMCGLLAQYGLTVVLQVPVVPGDYVYIYYAEKEAVGPQRPPGLS